MPHANRPDATGIAKTEKTALPPEATSMMMKWTCDEDPVVF